MAKQEINKEVAKYIYSVRQEWMAGVLARLDEEHIEYWKKAVNVPYEDLHGYERTSDMSVATNIHLMYQDYLQ